MTSDAVKSQKTINAAIEAMKQTLTPEKEADTSRDNQKISRNERIIIHNNSVLLLCFFCSDSGLFSWTTKIENIIICIIICKCFYLHV